MCAFVCFYRRGKPCEWVRTSEIKDKTAKSLGSMLKLQKESLTVVTPFIAKPLEPNKSPLAEYPNLVMTEQGNPYPPAPFHVRIVPDSEAKNGSIFVQTQTQLPDEFPLMEVRVDMESLSKTKASVFLQMCAQTFALKMTEPQLLRGETPVDSNESLANLYEISKSEHLVFKCVLDESEHKKVKTRGLLAAETVSSEEVYVEKLRALSSYWRPAFKESKIFDNVQMQLLFGDVDRILKVHESLLAELHKVKIGYAANLGAIFLNYVSRFKVSTSFVSNFKNVDELIKKKKSQSRYNESKLREIDDNNPDDNGQDFMAYYVTPVQRYPRYPLLARDIGKNTAPFHPDKEFLSLAEQNIDNANKNLDQTSHRVKQLLLMEAIQKELPDTFFLMEEGRELVLQQQVRITKPKSMNATLYLFNDLVLLCTKSKKQSVPVISAPLVEFRFCNGRPGPYSFTTAVDGKEYVVAFNDYEQKMIWMEEFVGQRNKLLANVGFDKKFVKWTEVELGESLYPMMNHDGVYYDGTAMFFAGVNASMTETSTVISYNTEDNKWSTHAAPFETRAYHTATLVDGTIYVAFGQAKNNSRGNIWRCRWGTNEWQQVDLHHPAFDRAGHTAVAYKGTLVFYGGRLGRELNGDVLIFNIASNNVEVLHCETMAGAPAPRAFHAAVVVDDSMIVIGGVTPASAATDVYQDIYIFNLKDRTWSQAPLRIPPRAYHRVIAYNKYLFVIGGTGVSKSFDMEVINTDGWSVVPVDHFGNMPLGLGRFAAVYLGGGRIMTQGGIDSYGKTPFACSWIMDVKEGFNEGREYVPKKRKSVQRQVIHLNFGSPDSSSSSSSKEKEKEKETPITKIQAPESLPPRGRSNTLQQGTAAMAALLEAARPPVESGGEIELKARQSPLVGQPRPVSTASKPDAPAVSGGIDFASIMAARNNLRKCRPDAGMTSTPVIQTDAPQTPQKQVWPEAAVRNTSKTPIKKDLSDPVFVMPKLRPVPGKSALSDKKEAPIPTPTKHETKAVAEPAAPEEPPREPEKEKQEPEPAKEQEPEPAKEQEPELVKEEQQPELGQEDTEQAKEEPQPVPITEEPQQEPEPAKQETEPEPVAVSPQQPVDEKPPEPAKKEEKTTVTLPEAEDKTTERKKSRRKEGESDRGHRKSTFVMDRSEIVAPPQETNRRSSLGPARLGSKPGNMSVQEFYQAYNIDVSRLNMIEQSSTRMKVVRLLQAMNQNNEDEAKVMKMEAMLSGKPPPDTPMILKIVDDMVKKLIKITTSMTFEEVQSRIFEKIGRDEPGLTILVDEDVEEPLNDETLAKAESAVFTNRVTGLIVSCPP